MILKASIVVPLEGPPISDGAVMVDDDCIVAVGPASELVGKNGKEVHDLGGMVLLPGLINAHCHLDYTTLRYAISPQPSFTAWVRRINAIKRTLSNDDYEDAIARGFRELQRWGTTSVCNIESIPELMTSLPEPPIRTWWCYEMIDIRHRVTTDDVVRGALSFFQNEPDALSRFGLSPHAPYTASRSLYRLAGACAGTLKMLLTTHVAESREEREMFGAARGPLYDFMQSLGRSMEDCGSTTPFNHLWRTGAIDRQWLLAHMNELSENDFSLLASLTAEERPNIVHCPGSHAYFNHSPFPYRRLHELGLNLCVGTDSLASTHSLSLLGELRRLRRSEPWLSAPELLATVTTNAARALDMTDKLGVLRAGACADLIALPVTGNLDTVHDEIVDFRHPIPWMMIDGKIRPQP
ncbi:MAG TPA: amidohydrolase family protein [Chthoniobacteraceae bacterium]|jgi:cytosine/adenosine deaminase-related metal-dependent hydrolase|nr:amidohydrolase family protein [Chthoniobacteraceae bacterium]